SPWHVELRLDSMAIETPMAAVKELRIRDRREPRQPPHDPQCGQRSLGRRGGQLDDARELPQLASAVKAGNLERPRGDLRSLRHTAGQHPSLVLGLRIHPNIDEQRGPYLSVSVRGS